MGVVIRQSFKATLVSYAGAVLGAFLVIFLYPKSLTAEQIGLTRVLIESSLLFSFFAQFGMTSVALRFFPYFKDAEKNHNGFLFIMFVVPLLGFFLFVLFFVFFQDFIGSLFSEKSGLFTEYLIYVVPLTLFMIYTGITETYSSLLQRIVVPKLVKEIVVRFLTIIIILLLFFQIVSLDTFVFLFTAIYGFAVLLNLYYVNSLQKINLKPDFGFLKQPLKIELLKFMLYMMVVGVGSNIAGKIDVFMLSSTLNLTGTGIFTIAYFIASFIEMPTRAIFQIVTPFASDALKNNDMKLVDTLYKRISINQFIIAGILFLLIWLNVDNIFKLMPNGQIFETGKYVLFFIGLAKVFDALTGINAIILGNSKYYYYTLFFIFFLAGLTIFNNYFLIPIYGISGSALATFISIFLYNLILIIFVKWKLNVQPFTKRTILGFLVLGVSYLIAYYIPIFDSVITDGIVRSLIFLTISVVLILGIKVSDDLNQAVKSTLKRFGVLNFISEKL